MLRRRIWIGICVLFIVLLVTLVALYQSAVSGPEFYRVANSVDPSTASQLGGEFEDGILQMHNNAVRESSWQLSVSDQQLNGWLRSHLQEKYAKYNPAQIENLCVSFTGGRIRIAFQLKHSYFPLVVCADLEPFMTAENDNLGLKLHGVYSGLIPLPTKRATEQITQALARSNVPIVWTSAGGSPVGILSPTLNLAKSLRRRIIIQSIAWDENRILISGRAEDTE